jgi:hypothetical protein
LKTLEFTLKKTANFVNTTIGKLIDNPRRQRPMRATFWAIARLEALRTLRAWQLTQTFKGNKSALPHKLCVACGRTMTWRKAWAKNWAEVKFCSERCRRDKRVVLA